MQPIRVRRHDGGFQIVAGERRWRAARLAGLTDIPAIVCERSENEAYADSLVENIHREDLNAMDRADALEKLKANLGSPKKEASWDEVAKKVHLSKRHILNLVGLKALPDKVQEKIKQEGLTEKHGRALKTLLNRKNLFDDLLKRIEKEKLSGDQALALARSLKNDKHRVQKELNAITNLSDKMISLFSIMEPGLLDQQDKKQLRQKILRVQQSAASILNGEGVKK